MPRHLIGDAHEWINEIPTVPTHSLAKLQPSQRSWDLYLCVFCVTWVLPPTYFFTDSVSCFGITTGCYVQQRGKKTLLSLTLICYCHLVGMAKIVRGSTFYYVRPWNTATWRFGWLTVLALPFYSISKTQTYVQLLWFFTSVVIPIRLSERLLFTKFDAFGSVDGWPRSLVISFVHTLSSRIAIMLTWEVIYAQWANLYSIMSIVMCVLFNGTTYSNCTGHLQNGSLAGVAHLL